MEMAQRQETRLLIGRLRVRFVLYLLISSTGMYCLKYLNSIYILTYQLIFEDNKLQYFTFALSISVVIYTGSNWT